MNPLLAALLASLTPEQAAAVVAEANRLYDAGRPNRKENTKTEPKLKP